MPNRWAKFTFGMNHPEDALRFLFGSHRSRRMVRLKYGLIYETQLARATLASVLRTSPHDVERMALESIEDVEFFQSIYGKLEQAGSGDSGGRQIGVPHLLYAICRIMKPDIVVETGVAQGVSTAFILKALSANNAGGLFSIDLPNYENVLVKRGAKGYLSAASNLPKG